MRSSKRENKHACVETGQSGVCGLSRPGLPDQDAAAVRNAAAAANAIGAEQPCRVKLRLWRYDPFDRIPFPTPAPEEAPAPEQAAAAPAPASAADPGQAAPADPASNADTVHQPETPEPAQQPEEQDGMQQEEDCETALPAELQQPEAMAVALDEDAMLVDALEQQEAVGPSQPAPAADEHAEGQPEQHEAGEAEPMTDAPMAEEPQQQQEQQQGPISEAERAVLEGGPGHVAGEEEAQGMDTSAPAQPAAAERPTAAEPQAPAMPPSAAGAHTSAASSPSCIPHSPSGDMPGMCPGFPSFWPTAERTVACVPPMHVILGFR